MNYEEIIQTYLNGNVKDAMREMERGGAVVTAMVLSQGFSDGSLSRQDLNRIASILVTRQVERNAYRIGP